MDYNILLWIITGACALTAFVFYLLARAEQMKFCRSYYPEEDKGKLLRYRYVFLFSSFSTVLLVGATIFLWLKK